MRFISFILLLVSCNVLASIPPKFKYKERVTVKSFQLSAREVFYNINENTTGIIIDIFGLYGDYSYLVEFDVDYFKYSERHLEQELNKK